MLIIRSNIHAIILPESFANDFINFKNESFANESLEMKISSFFPNIRVIVSYMLIRSWTSRSKIHTSRIIRERFVHFRTESFANESLEMNTSSDS